MRVPNISGIGEAESVLAELAAVFFQGSPALVINADARPAGQGEPEPSVEARYGAADRYKLLLDQIPAVVFMAYLDGGIGEAWVSPQIEATLGFSQREWLEDPVLWYRQIHESDKDRWSAEAAGMFLSGKPLRSSYRVRARDGRVIWFHCEARLVRREDGQPWFIHGVGFDITELKLAQEELREERNVVSAIFDTVGALIVVTDRKGRIVRFNRASERMTGCSQENARGRFFWDFFLVEDTDRLRTIFRDLIDKQTPIEYQTWRVNAQRLNPEADRRTIAWSAAVLSETMQMPTCVIASGIDVTEQRRAQSRFENLLESAPDAMVVVDQRGKIVLVNAQVEKLFGYERRELLGEEIEKLVPDRLRGNHPGYRGGFLSRPRVRPMGAGLDLYGLHRNGHEFPVEISLSPLETEEGVLVSSAIRDISERKKLEQTILEIGEMERRRIGQDLHDGLGQHLTGVAFMGKALADRLTEAGLPEAAEAARIVTLLNESVRMTRELARGLLPVTPGERGLVSALEHWAADMRDLFRIDCAFKCADPVFFRSDALADHLYRLAQEAVTNAIRHGHARKIAIELKALNRRGTLSISDDGRGFELVPGEHMGLGLRTMNYRARMIGGSLSVQSAKNAGTVVRCLFPLTESHKEGPDGR